jgi:hypothetical protein
MRILIFISFLSFSLNVDAQKMVKSKVADNITLKIPEEFFPMSDEDKQQRYESARLPIALYTDEQRLAEFGVNRSYSVWQEGDLEMLQEFYRSSIIELFDKVEFIEEGIKTIHKQDYVFFEFESSVYPENNFQRNISKYTYLMYALEGGTTYVFNFTSELAVKDKWQKTAHKIMESIKLK